MPGQPGRTRPTYTGETGSLTVEINLISGLEELNTLSPKTSQWTYGILPPVSRRFSGYPVYGDRVLLITLPGREPFAPVTMEEALNAQIESGAGGNSVVARAALAGLSAEGRRQHAYLQGPGYDVIVPNPGPDTTAILRVNPDYFGKSLPRSAAQVLAVDLHLLDLVSPISDPRMGRKEARRMLEATDWRLMAAELMH